MPEDSTKPLGPKLMNLPEGSLCDRSVYYALKAPSYGFNNRLHNQRNNDQTAKSFPTESVDNCVGNPRIAAVNGSTTRPGDERR
jgi:hypothetical protein